MPVIFSEEGEELVLRTRPIKIGDSLKMYCSSEGGDPPPTISWRRGGVPVPAHGQDVDTVSGRVTSTVIIRNIGAADLGAQVNNVTFSLDNLCN